VERRLILSRYTNTNRRDPALILKSFWKHSRAIYTWTDTQVTIGAAGQWAHEQYGSGGEFGGDMSAAAALECFWDVNVAIVRSLGLSVSR
jgi:hypothetical protein